MIHATELRIGNLVNYGGEILPVNSIHGDNTIRLLKDENSIGCFSIGKIQPIELTQEWLVRLGFVNFMGGYWELEEGITILNSPGGDNFILSIGTEYTLGEPFEFIHQLQNLFFALTGSELNVEKV